MNKEFYDLMESKSFDKSFDFDANRCASLPISLQKKLNLKTFSLQDISASDNYLVVHFTDDRRYPLFPCPPNSAFILYDLNTGETYEMSKHSKFDFVANLFFFQNNLFVFGSCDNMMVVDKYTTKKMQQLDQQYRKRLLPEEWGHHFKATMESFPKHEKVCLAQCRERNVSLNLFDIEKNYLQTKNYKINESCDDVQLLRSTDSLYLYTEKWMNTEKTIKVNSKTQSVYRLDPRDQKLGIKIGTLGTYLSYHCFCEDYYYIHAPKIMGDFIESMDIRTGKIFRSECSLFSDPFFLPDVFVAEPSKKLLYCRQRCKISEKIGYTISVINYSTKERK